MSVPHELPNLPTLPPLTFPLYHEESAVFPAPQQEKITPHLQSPSLSIAESFSTAYTSTTPSGNVEETSQLGSSSLTLPHNLRKSLSVDSFAQYSRDDPIFQSHGASGSHQNRVYGAHVDNGPSSPTWSTRTRGQSLSSVQRDYEPPFHPDFDVDRYDPAGLSSAQRVRLQSLKITEPSPSNASVRGGDLTLPARCNTTSAPDPIERGDLPSVSSASSLQSSKRAISLSTHLAGRLRSGSMGYNLPPKRAIFNPHIPPSTRQLIPTTKPDIVLLVIGAKGCGKSTLIKKGLSRFGLVVDSDTSSSEAPGTSRIRYIRRTGNILLDQQPESPGGTPQAFDVLEVEAQITDDGVLTWPQNLPKIDAVAICYDYSTRSSYEPVEGLLKHYRSMALPIVVLGCKTELDHEVDPHDVARMLARYDTGLIEVSSTSDGGKAKMKKSFDYLLKAILRQRGPNRIVDNRNPATPSMVSDNSVLTPTTASSVPSFCPPISSAAHNPPMVATHSSDTPDFSVPNAEHGSMTSPEEKHVPIEDGNVHTVQSDSQGINRQDSDDSRHHDSAGNSPRIPEEIMLRQPKAKAEKEPRPSQWADLDELLDKLLFLSVSGDDPTFATHFLLTYRRFTTPRSVLLAMQKRMRLLDSPSGDPMFACFAQMRICHLLETWIQDYPHDFAVKGTVGALNALIKSIISKTHLLHYGSEFLPFLEQLPSLVDEDTTWAVKAEVSDEDSEEYAAEEEEDEVPRVEETAEKPSPISTNTSPQIAFPSRERKPSLPIGRSRLSASNGHHPADTQPKQYIKDLVKLAQDVMNTDSDDIAQEITRQGVKLFMVIKPRDWLYFTFVSKKHADEPITAFNAMSNHIADWVVTLILCHDRPRNRARQIEKFIDIAMKLRNLNNYSALRAFVAGINNANDDATMEVFTAKSPDHAKNLRSWDVLLQQVRAHRAYRLALRNSKGSCIPAMEVHISDLIRAQEGNDDTNPLFPGKIHWGKFNMMGRFVTTTVQCQNQCRDSTDYDFQEKPHISALLKRCPTMPTEMQKSRLQSQDDFDELQPSAPGSQPGNLAGVRKIIFW